MLEVANFEGKDSNRPKEGGALTRCVYAYVAKDPFWVNLALKFQTVSVALKCFNGARTRSARSLNSPSFSAQALKSSELPKRGGENCKFRSFNCPKTLVESNYFKLCHLFNVWCKGCDLVHRELVQQISRWGNLTLRSDSRRFRLSEEGALSISTFTSNCLTCQSHFKTASKALDSTLQAIIHQRGLWYACWRLPSNMPRQNSSRYNLCHFCPKHIVALLVIAQINISFLGKDCPIHHQDVYFSSKCDIVWQSATPQRRTF